MARGQRRGRLISTASATCLAGAALIGSPDTAALAAPSNVYLPAWGIGDYRDPNAAVDRTLIVRWNGRSWTHVSSPTPPPPAHDPFLVGVAATSAGNAWAVGEYSTGLEHVLIPHWNGKAWHRQL
jgi:hypothetical protein